MKVTGSSIEQLEKGKPKGKCRKWRLWASTECGRKSRRFDGTWTQAQNAISAFVDELSAQSPEAGRFGPYAASWLDFKVETGAIRKSTARVYGTALGILGRSPIGKMELTAIGPEECRAAIMWAKRNPKKAGELSNTTLRMVYAVLRMVLQQAVDDGLLPANPTDKVSRPSRDTEERGALPAVEIAAMLGKLDSMPLDGRTMAVRFMAMLALRRGEACALLDADVSAAAVVRGTVLDATGEVGPPKTMAGNRTVPMPPQLVEKVREWREVRAALGFADAPTLCCNTDGGILRPQCLWRWWMNNRAALGCDGVVLHQLRHSNLTMMARHMGPYDLQRYAGWSSISMAMTYVHEDSDAVAAAVADAWCGLDAPNLHHPAMRELSTSA